MFKGLPIAILSGMAEQSYIVDSRAQFEPLDIDVVYTSRHPDQQGRNELGAVFSGNLDLPHGFGSNSEREVSERRVPRVLVISYDHGNLPGGMEIKDSPGVEDPNVVLVPGIGRPELFAHWVTRDLAELMDRGELEL